MPCGSMAVTRAASCGCDWIFAATRDDGVVLVVPPVFGAGCVLWSCDVVPLVSCVDPAGPCGAAACVEGACAAGACGTGAPWPCCPADSVAAVNIAHAAAATEILTRRIRVPPPGVGASAIPSGTLTRSGGFTRCPGVLRSPDLQFCAAKRRRLYVPGRYWRL